jgi:hypothetical protein
MRCKGFGVGSNSGEMQGGDAMTTVSSSPFKLEECALVVELERERERAFAFEGKLLTAVRKGDVGERRVSWNCRD